MDLLEKGRRRSGFTFAPEAATDRLRDIINKPIADDDLLHTAEEVYRRGWKTIKMYFMIGHPTQTLTDVQAIADLSKRVLAVGRRVLGNKANVRIGVSTLVPKPHTPFQWVPMAEESIIRQQIRLLKQELKGPGIHFTWNDPAETLAGHPLHLERSRRNAGRGPPHTRRPQTVRCHPARLGAGRKARRLGRVLSLRSMAAGLRRL
jgi:radical SAM superfamily enzyme YgiQ (UPF0313 family)